MKDNFSIQAQDYSKFRPHYPVEMIQFIVSQVRERGLAWDVATGNGQVAAALSPYFRQVFATDISQKQLDNAVQKDNIIYKVEPAESSSFETEQFDLITIAQAIHWFNFGAFYNEVRRVLKPDGVLAVMGYGLFYTNPATDEIIDRFYDDIIGEYWDAERSYIDEEYRTIPFPFGEIKAPEFINEFVWDFDQLTGYLRTWSAVQHYINKVGNDPVDLIKDELKTSWEEGDKKVYFPLLLRIGKMVSGL